MPTQHVGWDQTAKRAPAHHRQPNGGPADRVLKIRPRPGHFFTVVLCRCQPAITQLARGRAVPCIVAFRSAKARPFAERKATACPTLR